ncbi:MAG: ribosomal L7Ae/L30e/S12e/Gadd45 family protein [Nanoarchaeota archaeon]
MAKKDITEIKKYLKEDKVIIGTDKTLKGLRAGKMSKIVLSLNCPEDVENDINHYSKISNVKVVKLDIPNDELGIVCKKPYSISVLGILK